MAIKRVIYEWTMIASVGAALALSTLWVVSKVFDPETYHFEITTARSLRENRYFIFGNGDLTICNQIDVDASGNACALILSRTITLKDLVRGDQNTHFTIPGFGFDYYSNAPLASLVWSVRLSLLVPVALLIIVAKVFRGRPTRLWIKKRSVASGAIQQTPAPPV